MHYTYILYSPSVDQSYTGYTSVQVEKRLERHNNGWTQSTKSGIPWMLKTAMVGFELKALLNAGYLVKQK